MGLRMKNSNILGVQWKIWFLGGDLQKTNIEGGLSKKGGAWSVCRFKGGTWQERGSGILEGGWYPNAHSAPSPPKPTAEIKKNIWMHHCLLYIANHLSHKCCNDLNIYIQKWTGIYNEHNQRNKFLDSLSSNSFIPLILQPTRITSYCNTLLDNIISIVIDPDVMYSLTFTISDNLLQFAIIPNMFGNISGNKSNIYERDWSKFDQGLFL